MVLMPGGPVWSPTPRPARTGTCGSPLCAQAIGVTAGGSDPNCLVQEELEIQAQMYRVPADEVRRRMRRMTEQLELTGLERRLCNTLSGGQRRRLDIALGLIHSPQLVFLDEPTTGLDPQSRSNLWDHIRALRTELTTTVFLTTHYLEEADGLCDRVLVIDNGKIIASGAPEELKRLLLGIMLPMTLGPGWLQGIARATAFRYIIDGMRAAFQGRYGGTIMVEGIVVAVGMAAVCVWVASRAFVRENA
jgi:hypothetical protein